MGSVKYALLFGLLITAAVQDVESGKVSNRLIATGLVAGLVIQVFAHGLWGVCYFLGNSSVPVILLYLLFQMRVLGAGDIKLFSMIGSILTTGELCRCMVYSFFAAGAGAVLFLFADQRRWQRLRYAVWYLFRFLQTRRLEPYYAPYEEERLVFAFSVPILFGTALALF